MEMVGEALQEKARELADMVGSVVVDEALPLEVLEAVADCLKEDCRKGGVAWRVKRKSTR